MPIHLFAGRNKVKGMGNVSLGIIDEPVAKTVCAELMAMSSRCFTVVPRYLIR